MTTSPQSLFVILEGGGAKGVGHVGALHAIEEPGIGVRIAGIAGTSAGAIVATLRAAGYRPSEILCLEGTNHILQHLEPPPTAAHELLGELPWRRLQALRWATSRPLMAAALVGLPLLLFIGAIIPPSRPEHVLLVGAFFFLLYRAFTRVTGITTLQEFRGHLGALLAERKPHRSDVTFREAENAGWLPLKIIASDLTHKRLAVFSAATTPDIPVADAVMASIAIPIVFEPWHITHPDYGTAPEWVREGREPDAFPVTVTYADGGMIANLPAWAFDLERSCLDDSTLIAIELGLPKKTRITGPLTGAQLLSSIAHTAIFGAGEIGKRIRGRNYIAKVQTTRRDEQDLGVLDFDAHPDDLRFIARTAKQEVLRLLERTLVADLPVFKEIARTLHETLCDIIRQDSLKLFRMPGEFPQVRVSIVALPDPIALVEPSPEREGVMMGVQCSSGAYSRSLQPGSTLPHAEGLGALMDRTFTGYLATADRVHTNASANPTRPLTFQIRDPAWPELTWAFAVPLLHQKELWMILIESSHPLEDPQHAVEMLHTAMVLALSNDIEDDIVDV